MSKTYENFTDEELIRKLRGGEEDIMDYLLNKYKNLVKAQAGSYFIPGADEQDILQEGMIGLFKAIRDFEEGKDACFSTFARLCISSNIQTAVNKANRKKQEPLNTSVSLSVGSDGEDGGEVEGLAVAGLRRLGVDNPEHNLMLSGLGYKEIATILGKESKSVDNAISRVKTKARKYIAV